MSLVEFLGGGTFFAILTALWRGLKIMAREEVEHEKEDQSKTLDLSDINNLRKAIEAEMEKRYEAQRAEDNKRIEERAANLEKKLEEQKLLHEDLNRRFLQQVIESKENLSLLNAIQTELRTVQKNLDAAEKDKLKAEQERDNARKEAQTAIAAATASDKQARESLELAERLQKAQIESETLIGSLQTQIAYLQGVEQGLIKGIRNLPVAAQVDPVIVVGAKTEEKDKNEGI